MDDITLPYDNLKQTVDKFVPDTVTAIDTTKQTVTTAAPHLRLRQAGSGGGIELLFDKCKATTPKRRRP